MALLDAHFFVHTLLGVLDFLVDALERRRIRPLAIRAQQLYISFI